MKRAYSCEKYMKDIHEKCNSIPSLTWEGKIAVLQKLELELELHIFSPGNEKLTKEEQDGHVIITIEKQFNKTVYTLPS